MYFNLDNYIMEMYQIDKIKLRAIMAKKKISTFSQLSKMLGISKNQLSNILSDKYSPIKSNIVELAKFLEVEPLKIISKRQDKSDL